MNSTNDKIELPQPDQVSAKDKENAFGAYIMMFAGAYFPIPLIEIITSIIYFSYYKKRSRYVAFHAHQSMMGQIPITIVNMVFFVWAIIIFVIAEVGRRNITDREGFSFLIFLGITAVINIIYITVSLVIAFKAKKGEFGYLPLLGKISYNKLYGENAIKIEMPQDEGHKYQNRPPE